SDLSLSAGRMSAGDPGAALRVSVTVGNTGRYRGIETMQLYLRDTVAVPAPRWLELRDFKRVELDPGEIGTVEFTLTPAALAQYGVNPHDGRRPQPDRWPVEVHVGGSSQRTLASSFVLTE
ncbi:MAG TPA: fibronectin type III-like domain-contianing protein, partial [Arenibaculum sp.]|nr:fibronectin type III-like domain-contianing protein [Arenibaculum sp.]